jgi:diguanylate cyclase (GGDEF)-like protein
MQEQMIQFESEGYSPSTGKGEASSLFEQDIAVQATLRTISWRLPACLLLPMLAYALAAALSALPHEAHLFPPALRMLLQLLTIAFSLLVFAMPWQSHEARPAANVLILAGGFLLAAVLGGAQLLWQPAAAAPGFGQGARCAAVLGLLAAACLHWQPMRWRHARRGLPLATLTVALLLCWTVLPGPAANAGQGAMRMDYSLAAIALLAAWRFYRHSKRPQAWDCASLCAASLALALSGFCFAQTGPLLLAQLYQLTACYFVYRALFSTTVIEPYRRLHTALIESKSAEHMVQFLAYHDPLTNLPNRLLLKDRTERAIANAKRSKTKTVMICVGLDHIKTINDTLGHIIGDEVIKAVAVRLGQCINSTDTISRPGGDEFILVLQEIASTDAIVLPVNRMLEEMQQSVEVEGLRVKISISAGIAIYPDDGGDFNTLVKKADMAMHRAMQAGHNTYRFFDPQMDLEAMELLRMRNDLSLALERREFELHYQPQIDLASGMVSGAEALIRWRHPELGMVPPARFIPVAEETGLIVPIGEWVMFEACRQAAAWRTAGLPPLLMSVNLSGVQFMSGNVERTVIDALNAAGLQPSQLELELTESILIQDLPVLATVRRLKALGVQLAIDDFGTGYSSFSYLKRFAVNRLKIDQSFVRDLAIDPDNAAIVKAVIQMAHSLGLQTVAEGVEDQRALAHLQELQCDQVQGYYFAKPMPAAGFAA